jgi:F-type H+-transporting ATPase subunit delta
MENERVAKRYAKSIFDLSKEKNLLESIHKDFAYIHSLINESKEFRLLIQSPIINSIRKLEILNKALSNQLNAMTFTFMDIVFKRHREAILPLVANEFIKLYQKEKNITEVTLISASELSNNFISDVQNKVEKLLNTTVSLKYKIQPEIIGGFILRFEGKEYDGSIASKLNKLKRQFQDISFIGQI